ncbi:universal stress protein [Natronobacterium texcoconense]|uniref:Nucleotide-binding universal stress protein, UspA family n=1 Tax=Natronobacterium texcoconense TaxID=1095778 RepID=A0A1H1BZH7_NATTX|nr:universal stress protein [Natronobacterium texcoconense]SDQ57298.1 Nucleotide-binding universal stress protein, UspA family [Natronobacterium texcoconense]
MSRILVPVDGSPLSRQALEFALEEYEDVSIVALHVIDPSDPGYSSMTEIDVRTEPPHGSEEWYERAGEEEEEIFEEARALADEHGVELEAESAVGEPTREIVDYAEDHDVDQIVMGGHGRAGPSRLLLGSVAESVVYRAPVTVTVVRDDNSR